MAQLKVKTQWQGLDEAFAALEAECTAIVRGVTVSAWKAVLQATPQFAGGMAASWTYSIGTPVFEDRSHLVPTRAGQDALQFVPYQRGSTPAIAVANSASAGNDARFKLGDRVYFANGADHGEGPYSQDVEDGKVELRAVNLPDRPVGRTLDEIESRYGLGISRRAAGQLKNLRIF